MKTHQTERAVKIVELYLSKSNKEQHINEAAKMGRTVAQMLVDHEGELPGGSGFYHELVSSIVDKLRHVYITYEERRAEAIVHRLEINDRYLILASEFYKRRVNEKGERYTRERIAVEIFGITDNEYKYAIERIRALMLEIDSVPKIDLSA